MKAEVADKEQKQKQKYAPGPACAAASARRPRRSAPWRRRPAGCCSCRPRFPSGPWPGPKKTGSPKTYKMNRTDK